MMHEGRTELFRQILPRGLLKNETFLNSGNLGDHEPRHLNRIAVNSRLPKTIFVGIDNVFLVKVSR